MIPSWGDTPNGPALKAQNMTAQGNALGTLPHKHAKALKGRYKINPTHTRYYFQVVSIPVHSC